MDSFTPNTDFIQQITGINLTKNHNFLSPLGYMMTFVRLPNTIYDLQSVAIPTISLGETSVATPFARIPEGGDHIQYGNFPMTFKIDEDMTNYTELLTWWQSLGPPTDFDANVININRPDLRDTGFGRVSDGILTVLTAENLPNLQFYFRDLVPLQLSEVIFDTRDEDVVYITASALFEYSWFKKLPTTT